MKRYVRPVLGFFAAIFSVVTQFDVCPVGWYNHRMVLFRGPGESPAIIAVPATLKLVWFELAPPPRAGA